MCIPPFPPSGAVTPVTSRQNGIGIEVEAVTKPSQSRHISRHKGSRSKPGERSGIIASAAPFVPIQSKKCLYTFVDTQASPRSGILSPGPNLGHRHDETMWSRIGLSEEQFQIHPYESDSNDRHGLAVTNSNFGGRYRWRAERCQRAANERSSSPTCLPSSNSSSANSPHQRWRLP